MAAMALLPRRPLTLAERALANWYVGTQRAQTSREINPAWNVRALTLKAALLRNLGRPKDALDVLAAARRVTDPFDVRLMAELWLVTRSPADAAARTPIATPDAAALNTSRVTVIG